MAIAAETFPLAQFLPASPEGANLGCVQRVALASAHRALVGLDESHQRVTGRRQVGVGWRSGVPRSVLSRTIHDSPTAAAHLRTLEREIDLPLLEVLPSTSLGRALRKESEYADFSSQSTHLHALATDPHEQSGLEPISITRNRL